MQYTDDVLQNCMPETYTILLTDVTSINSISKGNAQQCYILAGISMSITIRGTN